MVHHGSGKLLQVLRKAAFPLEILEEGNKAEPV
jgi:hypothetical protein